jgi:protein TonB
MNFQRILASQIVIVAILLCLCDSRLREAHVCASVREVRQLNVAVLDFGETPTGMSAAEALRHALAADTNLKITDRVLVNAAASGAGYAGSLNMTLEEARNLGAAIGCDFFITGDAQTLRRSPSSAPVYHEAYASIFLVSATSGKLLLWTRAHFEAAAPADAEKQLLAELNRNATPYARAIFQAHGEEAGRRTQLAAVSRQPFVYEDAPTESNPAAKNFRAPQPYRRLRPPYTAAAAQAEAEATVDASIEIDTSGEVVNVLIVRWAGFGLDDATIDTIRQLHFRPAMRDGAAVPVRILLRYNFRRPPKSK